MPTIDIQKQASSTACCGIAFASSNAMARCITSSLTVRLCNPARNAKRRAAASGSPTTTYLQHQFGGIQVKTTALFMPPFGGDLLVGRHY
uniref:Uncharacterized protein n=1 Tax=Candidatus Kentrum sp. DK TaxID=2126562 RepID=A0A450S094_9GAMM|nr:MAG: hypothetical protein BECKDK2373C_GA0170839_100929 [Candidatus Kentron sp. DK]VFJ44896.1 MAG: hypothetical protein BECKDK2373B_GA0170837_100839 [Candidatus Kentron sp. DK]